MRHHTDDSEDLSDTRSEDEENEHESEGDYDYESQDDHTVPFRCKRLCDGAKTLGEMATMLHTAANHLF